MSSQSEDYASLKDLYSCLRATSEYVIVENVQDSPSSLQEQTPPENRFLLATSRDEDGEETNDAMLCRSSSPQSSVGGCPSNSSEDAGEPDSGKTMGAEVIADMRTTSDSRFITRQGESREDTQRSGVIGRRMRSLSDTTFLNSASRKSAENSLRKCRRYMSFPHISTLPHETEYPCAHDTHTKMSGDFTTVSVLAMSEGFGSDEEFNLDSEEPSVVENGPAPREELVKTWSREETRERALSEPDPSYWEPEFQKTASSRRMSDPGRLLFVESLDGVLGRPSRSRLLKKLERLVEENPQEDSGDLARACSVTSLPEVVEDNQKLRQSQDTLGERETTGESGQDMDSVHQTRTANMMDGEEVGTMRYCPLQLSAGDVIGVTRSTDIERILEAEDAKRRLRNDLTSEKATVRNLEKETGDLRREIYRREDEIKALQHDVCQRQNLLDEVIAQDKQKAALVSGLQELADCTTKARDNELRELQVKVGELQECKTQLGQVQRQLGQITENNYQFRQITEWFIKLDSQLSRIESAMCQLALKTASQAHKEDVDGPGQDQERCLLQTKLENSEKERVLLENANKKLMEEVLSLRVMSKREDNLSTCTARVHCKDLALENLIRLESGNKLLKKELQAVRTELQATKRGVQALRATAMNPTAILLECENRALKAELDFFRERQARTTGRTFCAKLEESRRAREYATRVLGAAGDQENAVHLASWQSSRTELEMSDESSVCCDFTTECESDDSHRRSKAHSQRTRRMDDRMMTSAAEKERSLARCRHSTALWLKQAKKRIH